MPGRIDRPGGADPVPKLLDWNLWLGVASQRPFKKEVYHPFKWRGWFDFGAGALGDMGCHIIDPVVWSLGLGPALGVTYTGPNPKTETFPASETLRYRFAGTQFTAEEEFTMSWYDGGLKPKLVGPHVPDVNQLPEQGVLLIGESGSLVCGHGKTPVLFPIEQYTDTQLPHSK